MESDIQAVQNENNRLRVHISCLVKEVNQFKLIIQEVRREQASCEKMKIKLEQERSDFEVVKSARLADLKIKLEKERDIFKALNLSTQKRELKQVDIKHEFAVAQSNAKKHIKRQKETIQKLKNTIAMKNTLVRQLEQDKSRLVSSMEEYKNRNKAFFDKHLELAKVLHKTAENCSLLEAKNAYLEKKLSKIQLVCPQSVSNVVEERLSKISKVGNLCSGNTEVRSSWELPDGSFRKEYANGVVETQYPNGNAQRYNPSTSQTTYFYKNQELEITRA